MNACKSYHSQDRQIKSNRVICSLTMEGNKMCSFEEEERRPINRTQAQRVEAKEKIRFERHEPKLCARGSESCIIISKYLAVIVLLLLHSRPSCGSALPEAVAHKQPNLLPRDLEARSSELSFEYLGLKWVPSEQLCALVKELDVSTETTNQVNLVSFANNRIGQIDSSAFICIASRLKILNLRNNKIESISQDAFSGLNHLQVLLLAGNHLKAVPIVSLNHLAGSLRHLDLANNRIEALDGGSPALDLPTLISLSLKANPLRRIRRGALASLARLQTLTLTQTELNATDGAHLGPLEGLRELRYLHLDRLANLSSVDANYCESSRKLASLSLKSNGLAQVPHLTNCQALLSIDLSFNRISGTLDGNFSLLANLIDLYLGFNQLEWVSANAFAGLVRLQVLHLNSNNLKQIHPSAFVPLRGSLYELNLAHNTQLTQVSQLRGLEQLASFKAHGNKQLSKLPYFPRARLLAFTYAYHCCDYLGTSESQTWRKKSFALNDTTGIVLEEDNGLHDGPPAAEEGASLARLLFHSIVAKLARFLWPKSSDGPPAADHVDKEQNFESQAVASDEGQSWWWPGVNSVSELATSPADDDANAQNLSELVLWPGAQPATWRGAAKSSSERVIGARGNARVQSEVGAHRARRWARQMGEHGAGSAAMPTAAASWMQHFSGKEPAGGHLIDELILQVKQIRFAHSVGPADEQMGAQMAPHDYALTATGANEPGRQEGRHHFLLLARSGGQPTGSSANHTADHAAELAEVARRVALMLSRDFDLTRFAARRSRAGLDSSQAGRRRGRHTSEPDDQWTHLEIGEPERGSQVARRTAGQRVQCLPQPGAFQPCRDLFDTIWLRASIWLVFLLAFVGNILVIVVLASVRPSSSTSALTSIMWFNAAHSKRHIDVPRFLVLNLAVADLLMAIYLGLLAFVDLSTVGEFRVYAIKWQHSAGCQLAGFLAVLSSELSVFILAIITLERNYAITNAVHLNRRLSLQKAMFIMVLGYLYAFTMAILPLNGINDYRKFSICLPLDFQPQLSLWHSPANLYLVTLVGINTLSFLLLVGCYLRMYCAIRGSQAWNTNDLKIAKRMSILVLTDFFCWMPIIFVGSLGLLRNYLIGPQGLKVLIVFVLPLNSLANPFLYAITTKKFKRDLKVLKKRLRLGQLCELLSLSICFITSWRRPRRRANYAQATVAIRRNQHKGARVGKVGSNSVRVPLSNRTHQLEIIVAEPQRRRLLSTNHPKVAGLSVGEANVRTTPGPHTRTTNPRPVDHDKHHGGPRKGSQLLAKTIRLMRGAHSQQSVNAEDAFDESRGRNPANTFNPVTMNKTTCFSCQQPLVANGHSCESREDYKNTYHEEEVEQEHQFRPSTRPRIVLDTIGLCPNELWAGDNAASTPREFIAQQQLHARQVRSHLCSQASWQSGLNNKCEGSFVSGAPANADAGAASKLQAQLTPGSADSRASDCGASGEHEPSPKIAHASCQTILINDRESQTRIRSPEEADLAADARSVSACAFNWPTSSSSRPNQLANKMSQQLKPISAPNAQVYSCCSCDAIGAEGTRKVAGQRESKRCVTASSSSQSRSINKLMFGPFAKAWSTLQLSLQPRSTSVTPATVEQTSQRLKECPREHSIRHAQQSAANNGRLSASETSCETASESTDQINIIDDILQMSSPMRKRLLSGRRMSRSCDLIISYAPSQDPNSTSAASVEPNPSSFEHSDDQRILLATINQLTTRRKKRRHIVAGRQEQPQQQHKTTTTLNSTRKRPTCTRCRSWSPALLDKLEDCMYQIRSRLPKLGGAEQSANREVEREYEVMTQQSPRHSSTTSTGLSISRVVGDPQKRASAKQSDMSTESDSSCEAVQLNSNSTDDLEVDDFNEIGFVEWTRNMQKKAPLNCYSNRRKVRRLHHQLSGNSDTLSSHTVGTTLTNLSFDSTSNIPTAIIGCEQQASQETLAIANKRPNSID